MWKSSIYMHIYIYVNIHTYIHTDRQTDRRIYIYFMVITATGLEPPSLTAIYLVQSIYLYMYTHVCVFDTYQQLSMAVFHHSPWKGLNLRQESTLCQLGRMPPVNLVKPDKTQRTPANPANLGKPWQTRQTWQTMREVVS